MKRASDLFGLISRYQAIALSIWADKGRKCSEGTSRTAKYINSIVADPHTGHAALFVLRARADLALSRLCCLSELGLIMRPARDSSEVPNSTRDALTSSRKKPTLLTDERIDDRLDSAILSLGSATLESEVSLEWSQVGG